MLMHLGDARRHLNFISFLYYLISDLEYKLESTRQALQPSIKSQQEITRCRPFPESDTELYMLTSCVYIQTWWSGGNHFNILKYKSWGFWSLPEHMDFSWLRSPGSLRDRFNCYIRVCMLIFYIWCAKVQGRQSGTVQMPLCKMFSDSLHLSDMVILALHQ